MSSGGGAPDVLSNKSTHTPAEMPAAGMKSTQLHNSDEKGRAQRPKHTYSNVDSLNSAAPASHHQQRISHNIFDSTLNSHDDSQGLLQVPRNQSSTQFGKKAALKD